MGELESIVEMLQEFVNTLETRPQDQDLILLKLDLRIRMLS